MTNKKKAVKEQVKKEMERTRLKMALITGIKS